MSLAILSNSLDTYIMGYSTCEEILPEEMIEIFNNPTNSRLSDRLQYLIIYPSGQSAVDPA